jgi:hypothetical protein
MQTELQVGQRVRITRWASGQGELGTIVEANRPAPHWPFWVRLDDGSFTPETRDGLEVVVEETR